MQHDQVCHRPAHVLALDDPIDKALLHHEFRMLELRKSIRSSAEDMAAKGLMSVSEMLDNINDENQAALNKLIHEIELLKAVYGLKYTLNDK